MKVGIVIELIANLLSISIPIIIKDYIDINTVGFKNLNYLFVIGLASICQALFISLSTYLITSEGDKQIAMIRKMITNHLIDLPLTYFDTHHSGKLTSRVMNDVSLIRNFLTTSIPGVINGFISIIISVLIVFWLDWKLALITLIILPINIIVAIPFGKANKTLSENIQFRLSQVSSIISENIQNIRTIKLNQSEKQTKQTCSEEINKLYGYSVKIDKIFSISAPIQSILSLLMIISIFLYGIYRVKIGTLTQGSLVAFIFILFQLTTPINNVLRFYENYKTTEGSTEELTRILNYPRENGNFSKLKEIKGSNFNIRLNAVNFSYDNKQILNNINLVIHPKEKIAIVGETGVGKTTIINLITRLYNPDKGNISLNGIDCTEYDVSAWRGMFSTVSQNKEIFTGTILENIKYGVIPIPTYSEIQHAVQIARLDKDIGRLPKGLNTYIGEQGIMLSGGQKQRIQIARAFLRKSNILILDEATSSLDSENESKIFEALSKELKNTSVISIAHRLSTIVNSNRIYFLENKTITSVGTHEELMKNNCRYRSFVDKQLIHRR